MTRTCQFVALAGLTLGLGAVPASALVLDPAQCGISLSCDSGSQNEQSAIVAYLESQYAGIAEVYKQDEGGGESGSFADDYSTAFFNTPTDPEDALISWDGPDAVNCITCYVLVKDGEHDPGWYLIDISGWDGMESLDLQNFWPADGAISNVSIWVQPIPIPAALWLFGSGLLGLAGLRRRRRS